MIASASGAPATAAPGLPADASGPRGAASDPAAQQDRFLKLLVAQLNNQDPMNPLDNAQMTSQIAQINTVSGIERLNQTMQAMAAQFNSLQVLQGAALVGRQVLTEGAELTLSAGKGQGGYELGAAASAVQVDILGASGQLLERLNLGPQGAGRHRFDWDAQAWRGAPDAGLRFRVSAVNAGTPLDATALCISKISAAGAQDGQLRLTLENGKTIGYDQIRVLL